MTRAADSSDTPVQPALADLLARYLHRQADAHATGLAPVEPTGEVVPFEAAPVQTVDARLAWDESLTALRLFSPETQTRSWTAPPEWASLVAAQEPATALAFSVGNYPQLVRHVRPLLAASDLTSLKPSVGRSLPAPSLAGWAHQQTDWPHRLVAVGALRLARQFDEAEGLIAQHRSSVPGYWREAWTNEEAALLWHRGQADAAADLWAAQEESTPVLFNRGMAALFLGRPAVARSWLKKASDKLPEAGAWHHLAGLYLALAEMRR
jgi:hypothetical protein